MRPSAAILGTLAALSATPALAQTAPAVVLMPSSTVAELRAYLGKQPFDQVEKMVGEIEACFLVQTRPTPGASCPAVSQELAARAEAAKPKAAEPPAPASK